MRRIARAPPSLKTIFIPICTRYKLKLKAFQTITGVARMSMPYNSHKDTPNANMLSVTGEISFIERVRKM